MTKALRLSPDLSLPIEATTEAIGFLGRRGSGKSYAAQKLAEELYAAGAQFVALDPVGNWYGLRLAANGKDPGLPIPVFGGLQGDVPLEPSAGKIVADTIVDRGISAVVDVSQFESDADKARFARDFCERFYFRKKSAPSAVFLFLEEAQEFIPQNPTKDEPRMLHAFQRLAKLGRNFGIGVGMLSQRPQEVHKKVLNLCELLFVFQLTGVHERKAVEAWIGDKGIANEDLDAELPKLERGHPHAWSPAWLKVSKIIPIAKKWTFDASSTPKVGAESRAVRELSPIDLEKLRTDMAATIERAKADDPKELRRQIAQLEKDKRGLEQAVGDLSSGKHLVGSLDAEYDRGRTDGHAEGYARFLSDNRLRIGQVSGALGLVRDAAGNILDFLGDAEKIVKALLELENNAPAPAKANGNGRHPEKSVSASMRSGPSRRELPAAPRSTWSSAAKPAVAAGEGRRASRSTTPRSDLSRGQQKILNALAELEAIGVQTTNRAQLGMFAGYNLTGGTGGQHIADLNGLGLIELPDKGAVRLTDAGRAAAEAVNIPDTIDELHRRMLAKLPDGQQRILKHLIEIYPHEISRTELGAEVEYNLTGGTGGQHVADLVTMGAAIIPRSGSVKASELLFPEALV